MKILAHRGYWGPNIAPNSSAAIRSALEQGYGLESDIRDYEGKLVISHNVADAACQEATEVLHWLAEKGDKFCFAINIKADGIGGLLQKALQEAKITNYFTFDMSVPQMLEYSNLGLRYFTRQSEIESVPVLYEHAAGIWVDGFFHENWITEELLLQHLEQGKEICIVSPELHGREPADFWRRLTQYRIDFCQLSLCTDYPDKAKTMFQNYLN